jgi:DNA-binding transcriptional MerR regulator
MGSRSLRTARSHSIGEVINHLKPEFPDLSVSKLRFLEGQGLVEPSRSASGYRMFTEDDVRRIEYILREQRDHYLPLKVIKSKLTAWEHGEESPVVAESGPPPEAYFAAFGASLTHPELMRSSGLSAEQLRGLVAEGLLAPTERSDGVEVFDEDDLLIAKAAHRLLTRGFEVRHLRALRLAADREVDLLGSLVAPLLRHPNPDNRQRSAEILADCAEASTLLQENVVRSRLRRLLDR